MTMMINWFDLATAEYREYSLITGGPLQGKFLMIRDNYRQDSYLKKCSPVLGESVLINKPYTLLISDKPDVNALIDPLGGYEAMKRQASIFCQGQPALV